MNTKEPQYDACLEVAESEGRQEFGLMSNFTWKTDPKRLGFLLARYKFVAKMLAGTGHVLEVGCADAFGSRVVKQEVQAPTAIDFDPVFVDDAAANEDPRWPMLFLYHDILKTPVPGRFDATYSLDVLEHIPKAGEGTFMANICASLDRHGILIIGTPSLESQVYASPGSKAGHVNCKTGPELRALAGNYFHNVFMFSMNDEVVHTGFQPMAHYLFALCCGPKR